MAVVSAPIRPTLLLYPGLGLTSECIGLCIPKAELAAKYRPLNKLSKSKIQFLKLTINADAGRNADNRHILI